MTLTKPILSKSQNSCFSLNILIVLMNRDVSPWALIEGWSLVSAILVGKKAYALEQSHAYAGVQQWWYLVVLLAVQTERRREISTGFIEYQK